MSAVLLGKIWFGSAAGLARGHEEFSPRRTDRSVAAPALSRRGGRTLTDRVSNVATGAQFSSLGIQSLSLGAGRWRAQRARTAA